MRYIDQTEFSSEDGSQKGNCMSACLASLLGIDISLVPNFAMMPKDTWYNEFTLLLKENDYEILGCFYFRGTRTWKDLLATSNGCDGIFMVAGPSPRAYVKAGHAVLYKDGVMLHDPYPSREGILNMEYAYMIEKCKRT